MLKPQRRERRYTRAQRAATLTAMSSAMGSGAISRHQEVARLLQRGDLRGAAVLCAQLTRDFPQFAPGWHSASFVELCLGNPVKALESIHRALASSASDARFLLQQARCLGAQNRLDEALQSAALAEKGAAHDAALLDATGSFYSSVGEYSLAVDAYSAAIALDPACAIFWFNRAATRRFLGQLAQAEDDYDRAIALRPDDHEACLNRSELRVQTPERNHIESLQRLLKDGALHWRSEVQLHYALAKEYQDLARHPEAWSELAAGAALRRRHLQYDVHYDVNTVSWIIDAFPGLPAQPIAGCTSAEPIFVIGLPRSGTTLVERILGSHSAVFPAGELNHFAAVLVEAAQRQRPETPLPRTALIEATRHLDFAALGSEYVRRARPMRMARAHFTDKMPLNYLYCGLIHRALPHAKIIQVTRHPMASCYAMFKTLFKDGYPFSYDFRELAAYYAGYRRLMAHWRSSMPGVIYEMSYERLVRDPAGEARELLTACGLPWESACLEFHRNPSATTSASASQVRRPMYDSSVDQWRHYEKQLEELRALLVEAGIDSVELQ